MGKLRYHLLIYSKTLLCEINFYSLAIYFKDKFEEREKIIWINI